MATKKVDAKSYAKIIDAALTIKGTMTWEQIMATVTAISPVPAGGWMTVRSGLQMLVNADMCVRLPGVEVEQYRTA